VEFPCVDPRLFPAIVTDAPVVPMFGETPVKLGVGRTVKPMPLLAIPATVTTTLPEVAPDGT